MNLTVKKTKKNKKKNKKNKNEYLYLKIIKFI